MRRLVALMTVIPALLAAAPARAAALATASPRPVASPRPTARPAASPRPTASPTARPKPTPLTDAEVEERFQRALGFIYRRQNEAAAVALAELRARAPQHPLAGEAGCLLATLLIRLRRFEGAREVARETLAQFPAAAGRRSLVAALAEAEWGLFEYDAARRLYQELAGDAGGDPAARALARVRLAALERLGQPLGRLELGETLHGEFAGLAALRRKPGAPTPTAAPTPAATPAASPAPSAPPGRVVLIFAFQLLCEGSQHVLEDAQRLARELPAEEFAVLGLAVATEAREYQTPERYRKFLAEHAAQFPYPVVWDAEGTRSFSALGLRATPSAVILDRDGKIAYLDVFIPLRVEKRLRQLLAPPKATVPAASPTAQPAPTAPALPP